MKNLGKAIFTAALLWVLLPPAGATAASRVGYYTLGVSPATYSTMGDATATVPVTVTNLASSTGSIAYIRIDFDANVYYISLSNAAPAGWTIADIKNAGAGQTYILYTTATSAIAPGASMTFSVLLTGANNGNIPAAAADTTDAIVDGNSTTTLTVNAANSNYFDRNGTGNSDTWLRRALSAGITATPTSVGPGGSISIILTITNRSSAAQATVQPVSASYSIAAGTILATGTANATAASGPVPASVGSLAAGASQTFQWVYNASGGGSLQFCNAGRNGASTATSGTACSNIITVGSFTAAITAVPTLVVSGQSVTVSMVVTNNGASTIQQISPTLNAPAGSTHLSGPTPNQIGTISPGASSAFTWTYSLAGSVGTTFTFSGFATDKNGATSTPSPSLSNPVTISAYSVSVAPSIVPSGSLNRTFTFHITNNGGYGLQQIKITTPSAGFVYSSAAGGCAGAWGVASVGAPAVITYLTGADYVPVGGACDFSATYASVPTVAVNTDYNFRIDVWDTQTPTNKEPRASLGIIVKVSAYGIALAASPASINPNCLSTITATVTPAPPNGSAITFIETGGTLDPHTTTVTGGLAQTTLRAPMPYNGAVPGATVTSTFQDASASIAITFLNGTTCSSGVKILDWREVIR